MFSVLIEGFWRDKMGILKRKEKNKKQKTKNYFGGIFLGKLHFRPLIYHAI
jgi:hypothetical protein